MKYQLIIILYFFLTVTSYGQCGKGNPSISYHNEAIVNAQGDTLNKEDSLGYYEGLHVYTDNVQNIYNDTTAYILGYYQHGKPIGEWIYHCKDGSRSVGQYQSGIECTSDGNGGWTEREQGIYEQKGVWKYFDTDQQLILTERYDHFLYKNKWVDEVFVADSNGIFVRVSSETKYRNSFSLRKDVTKTYAITGELVSLDYRSLLKDVSYEYYDNGNVHKKIKYKTFLGKDITIEKVYTYKGKLSIKTTTKESNKQAGSVWENMKW